MQPARGPAAMGGGRKGKGKPSRRRNPQKDWGDLEFLLCQALRHGSSKSALGWHDLRGKLGSNGWVSVKEAAEAMQVSEEDIKESVGWQRKEKTRVELDGSGDYVRALQGRTPDSGLSKDDFHSEELTVKDTDLLAHGTLTERIPSILSKRLVASGGAFLLAPRSQVKRPLLVIEPPRLLTGTGLIAHDERWIWATFRDVRMASFRWG